MQIIAWGAADSSYFILMKQKGAGLLPHPEIMANLKAQGTLKNEPYHDSNLIQRIWHQLLLEEQLNFAILETKSN